MPFLANIDIVDKLSQNNLRNRKVGTTANESKIFRQIGIFLENCLFSLVAFCNVILYSIKEI